MRLSFGSRAAVAAAVTGLVLATAGCATTSSGGGGGNSTGSTAAPGATSSAANPSAPLDPATLKSQMSSLCGTKPIKIAQVDGFGGNSWRKITRAVLKDELSACKNVSVTYAQANGDASTYINDINSYVAQHYDAIITFDDAGNQALSALRNAHKAGVVVVPYISDPGGKVGVDYDGYVQYGFTAEGQAMARWLKANLKSGANNVLESGGLAGGSTPTLALMAAVRKENTALGNPLKFLVDRPVASGWDPATNQKAIAGVLSKYKNINAIVSDYGVADIGALRAYVSAGRQIPLLATSATDNQLGCMWLQLHKSNPGFQMITLDGTNDTVRVAALKAMAALNKKPDTWSQDFPLKTFIDTTAGKLPTCQPTLPPDADLSSSLTEAQLKAVFSS